MGTDWDQDYLLHAWLTLKPKQSLRDREFAAVAALAALNTSDRQLEVHLNAALEAGCKPRELVEVALQTFIFGGLPASVSSTKVAMPKPKVIIFDVNETLLDLTPLKTSVGKALCGREEFVPLWFSTMLHYSL